MLGIWGSVSFDLFFGEGDFWRCWGNDGGWIVKDSCLRGSSFGGFWWWFEERYCEDCEVVYVVCGIGGDCGGWDVVGIYLIVERIL